MTEHDLLSAQTKLLRLEIEQKRRGVVFKHSSYVTTGIPDMTVALNGRTSWWEFKAGQRITGTGLQHLNMKRLEVAGIAHYVVFQSNRSGANKRTCIVRPSAVAENGDFEPLAWELGFNYQFVLECILKTHGVQP